MSAAEPAIISSPCSPPPNFASSLTSPSLPPLFRTPVSLTHTCATTAASASVPTEMKAVSFVANSIAAEADTSIR